MWDFTKTIRTRFSISGAATSWGVVDSEPLSIQALQLKAGVAFHRKHLGDSSPLQFTLQDNSVVTLSPDDALQMVGEALEYVDGIYAHARGLREALDAAQTAQEVLAVDVFRGWPTAS
ncbi:DUF4376 domain-containing protein [Sphingobium fuliginis]|uniref:DUF4376 domain-containing protein n=1 Tax=Sphingobium fuliginis (strain ATCC 27551) TaxID=336203 RepID=UPI0040328D78